MLEDGTKTPKSDKNATCAMGDIKTVHGGTNTDLLEYVQLILLDVLL